MAFAIFNIDEIFLYNRVEKSRVPFFNKILSNKHAAPPIFNFPKQSVRCGIAGKNVFSKKAMSDWNIRNVIGSAK